MKFYRKQNVYEAGLERIRFIFDEFPEVIVSFSGGKDSTNVLNLALKVAKEKNRLPLKVMFLDQEAEWQCVVEYVRRVSAMDGVEMLWYQIPLRLFNSTSSETDWLNCWKPGEEWMRPHEPNAITENRYGTDRFKELFGAISKVDFCDQPTAWLTGVRSEESPARHMGLTGAATYKHITYGTVLNKKLQHYTFHPLYDWSYTDIWKAIHTFKWDYCKIYDEQYRYGIGINNMRVSNLHHETSFVCLYYLQEIEKDTWERLCKRLPGVNTLGHLKSDAYACPKELPSMFKDWHEYRDYLVETLLTQDEHKVKFRKQFERMDAKYARFPDPVYIHKQQVKAVVSNDYHMTQLGNMEARPEVAMWRKWMEGRTHRMNGKNPFIQQSIQQGITPPTATAK